MSAKNNYLAMIPNCFLYQDYESDLMCLSYDLTTTEYEIKLTRLDFLAEKRNKKPKIEKYLPRGWSANRFYYVCPDGVIEKKDLPPKFGLIYFSYSATGEICLRTIKRCSSFHKDKLHHNLYLKLLSQLSYRHRSLMLKNF